MWQSLTGQFDSKTMSILETSPSSELIPILVNTQPIGVLFCLIEIMLHGDTAKLDELLSISLVNDAWRRGKLDSRLDKPNKKHAQQLGERSSLLSIRRVGIVEPDWGPLPVLHVPLEAFMHPQYICADETNLISPRGFQAGTRIILRCDEVDRPYFPKASYYEPGTVTYCSGSQEHYSLTFRHDPWLATAFLSHDQYWNIRHNGAQDLTVKVSSFEARGLAEGRLIALHYSVGRDSAGMESRFNIWSQVVAHVQTESTYSVYQVRIIPGQL